MTLCAIALSASASTGAAFAVTVASQVGAHLDSNLQGGGGTDDTRVLQRVLDQGVKGRAVHLLIDGPALVSGLDVYGNTTIECTAGGGLYLKDNSSRAIMRNAHRSRDVVVDERIEIRGCQLNGNRNRQPGIRRNWGNQEPDGSYIAGLQFFGVNHLTIENVSLQNIRAFAVMIANAQYITIRDIRVDDGSPHNVENLKPADQWAMLERFTNTDGIHFHGPIRYATLDGLIFHTGDDALAFNAEDRAPGDTGPDPMGPYVGHGPITDVVVNNVMLVDVMTGIRFLSSTQRIDRVLINNLVGTVRWRMAIVGHWSMPDTGDIGSIVFSNVNVDGRAVPCWGSALMSSRYWSEAAPETRKSWRQMLADEWDCPLFSLNARMQSLVLDNVVTRVVDGRPLIRVGPDAHVLNMNATVTALDPALQSTPLELEAGGRIEQLNLRFDWRGEAKGLGKNPIRHNGGIVHQLNWIDTPPVVVGAEFNETNRRLITIAFSQSVNSVDFKRGITIRVNGAPVRILRASRQHTGDAIQYEISTAVSAGDSVTWEYDGSAGAIENHDGDKMFSVAPLTIRRGLRR